MQLWRGWGAGQRPQKPRSVGRAGPSGWRSAGAGWVGSAIGRLVAASVGGVEALAGLAVASGGNGESGDAFGWLWGLLRLLLWWPPAVEACGVRLVVLLLLLLQA